MADNTCACCGAIIPEGRHICLLCEGENEVQHFHQQIPPVRTNGDRIRAMTDEELAEFFCQISKCCGNDASCSMCPIYDGCAQNAMCVERWLKQEASENGQSENSAIT